MSKFDELIERCQGCKEYPDDCGIYVSLALMNKKCKCFRPNMLKYLYSSVTFQEVPNEISLCISISNCPIKCKGCHSPELWEDKGTPLNRYFLEKLVSENEGISCICLMGGDRDPETINELAYFIKKHLHFKVAWYSGMDALSTSIQLKNFDYIKKGSYKEVLGGLESPTTNQKFYRVEKEKLIDITNLFTKRI